MEENKIDLKNITNDEFLSYCMNFSDYGNLCQLAIMEVIERGVKDILDNKEEWLIEYEKDEKDGKISIIHVPSFIGAVEELKNRLDIKYGRNDG